MDDFGMSAATRVNFVPSSFNIKTIRLKETCLMVQNYGNINKIDSCF